MTSQGRMIDSPLGHVWEGWTQGAICADVPQVGFRSWLDKDSAVNWLFLNGHKELARLVNKTF